MTAKASFLCEPQNTFWKGISGSDLGLYVGYMEENP